MCNTFPLSVKKRFLLRIPGRKEQYMVMENLLNLDVTMSTETVQPVELLLCGASIASWRTDAQLVMAEIKS